MLKLNDKFVVREKRFSAKNRFISIKIKLIDSCFLFKFTLITVLPFRFDYAELRFEFMLIDVARDYTILTIKN